MKTVKFAPEGNAHLHIAGTSRHMTACGWQRGSTSGMIFADDGTVTCPDCLDAMAALVDAMGMGLPETNPDNRDRKITELRALVLIETYRNAIGKFPEPRYQLMLQLLIKAGDDLPLWDGAAGFFKAWRQCDVIYSRSLTSWDMIVWHLAHSDPHLQTAINAVFPPEPVEAPCAPSL